MNILLRSMLVISISALTLSACQTADLSKQTSQNTNMPTVVINLDRDGDGVPDDTDMCPGTPMNIVTDERGCPFTGMGIGLKMEYRAFFAKGSSELSPEYQLELDKVAAKLQEYYTATMRIEGHASTDEIGETSVSSSQLNSLSRNRALIVKNYLIMQHQIYPNRLSTFSFGDEQPIASSDTEEGKSMNRRVYGVAIANFDSEEEMSMNRRGYGITTELKD